MIRVSRLLPGLVAPCQIMLRLVYERYHKYHGMSNKNKNFNILKHLIGIEFLLR